jgi:hypothetical protein
MRLPNLHYSILQVVCYGLQIIRAYKNACAYPTHRIVRHMQIPLSEGYGGGPRRSGLGCIRSYNAPSCYYIPLYIINSNGWTVAIPFEVDNGDQATHDFCTLHHTHTRGTLERWISQNVKNLAQREAKYLACNELDQYPPICGLSRRVHTVCIGIDYAR